ncbi:class F sortase [Arthrobacter sp. ISL-48]|uniref:class F sortase n=1 Tax=Arthrobacter sp. ISL-48 TaxID=2819110 RepID=UPI001BED2280|nr:class F sortase [Arthrobacter sp. ISL-48]MBT2534488.1 class F sortase [Arthrobacter sp. ISL-48]
MISRNCGRRRGLGASAAAGILLLLALAGCGTGRTGTADAGSPPSASAAASTSAPSTSVPATAPAAPPVAPAVPATEQLPPVMPASVPTTLVIPAIGVRTELLHLGLRENGSLEVPQDIGNGAPAGWYDGSPTPGERGPSVILGHVNALGGHTGVFADLRKLTPGAEINVGRADGSTSTFTVERGTLYGKDSFPTLEVYGNTPGSELRLITCDGYDPATGLFDDNYVVYAKLKA